MKMQNGHPLFYMYVWWDPGTSEYSENKQSIHCQVLNLVED